jgi:hypothetical protein
MSFNLKVVKDENGELVVEHTFADTSHFPDKIAIAGHVGVDGQVVDLSARVENFSVSGSRRQSPVY